MKNKRIILLLTIVIIYVAIGTSAKNKTTTKKPKQKAAKKPACVSNCTVEEKAKFDDFKSTYTRNYTTKAEECEALNNFCISYRAISSNNQDKNSTFKMALTGQEDKSEREKASHLLSKTGAKLDEKFMGQIANVTPEGLLKNSANMEQYMSSMKARSIKVSGQASEVNYGPYTGPVKDQGNCGGCWTFCAAAVLQFQQVLFEKKQSVMSEQMFLDCNGQGQSCGGGNPYYALQVAATSGAVSQAQYPYKQQDSACKRTSKIATVYTSKLPACAGQVNEVQLKQIADSYGVVGVVIGVANSLASYTSGIYYDQSCPTKQSHCVTLVGYGTDANGVDYWIIKNSWGRYFGENGYFKLRRGVNACGIGQTIIFLPCQQ